MDAAKPSFVLALNGADTAIEWHCTLSDIARELSVDTEDLAALMSETAARRGLHPRPTLFIVSDSAPTAPPTWTGADEGLTHRESEVLHLIVAGLENRVICEHLSLTINSIKSYIRSAYRKIGVSTRSQAILWAVANGFVPDPSRVLDDTLRRRPKG